MVWSAIGAIGGSLISSISGRNAADEANRANLRMYYADREWNKPINQVARLREAGLNPNLVYGGNPSVAGNTKGAPKMEGIGGYDVGFANALSAMQVEQAIKNAKADKEKTDVQIDNELKTGRAIEQSIREAEARTKGIELENKRKKHDIDLTEGTPVRSTDTGSIPMAVRAVWKGVTNLVKKGGGAPKLKKYHYLGPIYEAPAKFFNPNTWLKR